MRRFWESAKESGRIMPPEFKEWLNKIKIGSDYNSNMNADLIVFYELWKEVQELKK